MDPLSPVASVLAIATAAAQICKAISRLRAFGEVPARVYALRNEVTELEVLLRQIAGLLHQNGLTSDADQESLERILMQTKDHLGSLAEALKRVGHGLDEGKAKFIRRSAIWLNEGELFQGFQDEIRAAKANLNILLGASNS